MARLYYQSPDAVCGDFMPFGKDGTFYLFYLRDPRVGGRSMGKPFGWDLLKTKDFVHYEDLGNAIPHGTDEEQDQYVFSGSVIKALGQYHAFYTGNNMLFPQQGKPGQVQMHATSDDLLHWTKTDEDLDLMAQPGYDPDDWRDPFLLWDEERQEYRMFLGARKAGPKTQQTGRTVWYTSKDLKTWEFQGDFWAPDLYTMHEMPDVFYMDGWWYHIITEYSHRSKMVYRMSKSLQDPWLTPKDDAFDGRAYYAARTFAMDGKHYLFGWVPTKEGDTDKGLFQWGGACVPHQLYQREDGTLGCAMPDTVRAAFVEGENLEDVALAAAPARQEKVLREDGGDFFKLELDVSFQEGTSTFGLRFYGNQETGESYQYLFHVGENRVIFEKSPNWPWPDEQNIGQERPIHLEPGKTYHVDLIVDDTIATLYVDGVALNARAYRKFGTAVSAFATDGAVELKNITLSRDLK